MGRHFRLVGATPIIASLKSIRTDRLSQFITAFNAISRENKIISSIAPISGVLFGSARNAVSSRKKI